MKIEQVESIRIGTTYLVRVHTDTGLTGLGQTACWGYTEAVESIVRRLEAYLVGQDPLRIEHHWQANNRVMPFRGAALSGAISAVDIALWDIKGKHYGAPVWDLLGGRCRDRIRLHLLMANDGTPDSVAAEARAAADEGFTAIKFDPLPDGYQDMTLAGQITTARDLVAAAREAVRDDVDLIVEIHRKLTPMNAIALAEALVDLRLLFYEDPIQIDSIMSQGEIANRISIPVANGERIHSIWEFRELLTHGGPSVRPAGRRPGWRAHPLQEDRRHRRVLPLRRGDPQLPGSRADGGLGPPGHEHPQLRHPGVLQERRVAGERRLQDGSQARGRLHPRPGGRRPRSRAGRGAPGPGRRRDDRPLRRAPAQERRLGRL